MRSCVEQWYFSTLVKMPCCTSHWLRAYLTKLDPMLVKYWPTVLYAGPIWNRHRVDVSCLVAMKCSWVLLPSKHVTLNQFWVDAGPSSTALARHWFNVSCLLGLNHPFKAFSMTAPPLFKLQIYACLCTVHVWALCCCASSICPFTTTAHWWIADDIVGIRHARIPIVLLIAGTSRVCFVLWCMLEYRGWLRLGWSDK